MKRPLPPTPSTADALAVAQGLFYGATGIWPLLSYRSFVRVTGPKRDEWLVKTVGLLVAAVGLPLAAAGWRRRTTRELGLLASGCAAALAGVDLHYVRRGRISRVYLLDALAEAALVAAWARPLLDREGAQAPASW